MGRLSAAQLRQEISARNVARGLDFAHELSSSMVPSVIYGEAEGAHGNFLPASYARIVANPAWRQRLKKAYTASRFVPRAADRRRYELECANSSDALLMNVFCYPGVLRSAGLCGLLGIERRTEPEFGIRARTPLQNGQSDRTEIDMRLGTLLVEAKLTEGDFQRAPLRRLEQYRDAEEVFDPVALPVRDGVVDAWQLVRGALAAHARGASFAVICDARRPYLMEAWFRIVSAVTDCSLRTRLGLVTWQEIAAHVPPRVQRFLAEKYGIEG
jgi:hypothetical protein